MRGRKERKEGRKEERKNGLKLRQERKNNDRENYLLFKI